MATQASDLEAIDRLRDAHVAALNGGDAEGWAACFAADSVQMPPNFPAKVGSESIRGWSGGMLVAFEAEFSLSPGEVEPAGPDWMFERGEYTIVLTPKAGGDAIEDAGKYITLYRRQPEGGWLMARDIWNSNNPLPA